MFLQVSVCPHGGGHVWFYSGACMVLFGGHAWFYLGGMHGFIRGVCMVLFGGHVWFYLGGMHGFIGGHAWFYLGGMHGFIRGHAWFYSGGHVWFYLGGHAWFFQFFRIQSDTVNEWAVRILLECILVKNVFINVIKKEPPPSRSVQNIHNFIV